MESQVLSDKLKTYSFKAPAYLIYYLDLYAHNHNLSRSEMIRLLIEEFLREEGIL